MDEAKQMTAEHIEALASVAQSALDAWDSLGRPGRVRPPGYAEADAIVRLVAEVRRLTAALDVVRGDLGDTNAIADGYIARLRAEHAAALATARREGAEEMRERCAVLAEEHAIDASDAAFPFIVRVARDARALPLDASGGAPDCTGITAQWCPRCGDCTCPLLHEGNVEGGRTLNDPKCPLHAPSSPHGDAPGGAT